MQRYDKHARLSKADKQWSLAIRTFGKACESALEAIVLRRITIMVPVGLALGA